jgi:hypothetical protein
MDNSPAGDNSSSGDFSASGTAGMARRSLIMAISRLTSEELEVVEDLIRTLLAARGGMSKPSRPESRPAQNKIFRFAISVGVPRAWLRIGCSVNSEPAVDPLGPRHIPAASDVELLTGQECEVVHELVEVLMRAR